MVFQAVRQLASASVQYYTMHAFIQSTVLLSVSNKDNKYIIARVLLVSGSHRISEENSSLGD